MDNLELWSEGEIESAGWADRDALMKDYRSIMPYEFRKDVSTYLKVSPQSSQFSTGLLSISIEMTLRPPSLIAAPFV